MYADVVLEVVFVIETFSADVAHGRSQVEVSCEQVFLELTPAGAPQSTLLTDVRPRAIPSSVFQFVSQ